MSESESLSLARYLPLLECLSEAGADLVLVAGQAVNFWAEYYKECEVELLRFLPFASKDVDLFGQTEELYRLPQMVPGKLKRFRDVRQPVIGFFVTDSEPPLMIELLRSIYGPITPEKIRSRSRTVGVIQVIDPLSLLISKCHNASGLDQAFRQDNRHVQMMVLVTRAYFSDIISEIGGKITDRQCINEMKYLISFAKDEQFQKGMRIAERDFVKCFPVDKILKVSKDHPKIRRFYDTTLNQQFEEC